MKTIGIIGVVNGIRSEGGKTVMKITTGHNGSRKEETVLLEVAVVPFEVGMNVKLENFVRNEEGVLTPAKGTAGEISILNIEKFVPDEHIEPRVTRKSSPSMLSVAAKTAGKMMTFSDRDARKVVFDQATEVAREFTDLIRKTGQIISIQGRPYISVAGWSLLPPLEGANVVIASHEIHPDGTVVAEAFVSKDGVLVSRGFGACSERERPKIHDRLAMAQTRARGSALKARYSPLVVLAGYQPSIADEVEDAVPTCKGCQCGKGKPATKPVEQPKPTDKQIAYTLNIFGGDAKAVLAESASLGFLTFEVKDIPTPILKRIVEKKLNERKQQRAAAASKAA